MRTSLQRRGAMALACATLLLAGCDVHGVSEPGTLTNIVVTPNPQVLAVTATQQFTATGTDFSGARVTFTPTWSVAAGGGSISPTGVFTAGTTPGTFGNTVTASSGSVAGSATVVVTAGPLARIIVSPTPVTLPITGTQQFVAIGEDASGNVVQFTPTWSVVAGGGAVSSAGLFTAGTVVGSYVNTVQASNGGITGTATVHVTAGPLASLTVTPNPATLTPGATQQFTATGRDAGGNAVAITPTWSVVAGGGTISGSGLFTAGSTPGTYTNTVRATSGTLAATATVTVNAGPLASITVTPNPVTLGIGTAQQFTAVGRDAAGNTVPLVATWAVVAGGGTISGSGMFTAGNTLGTFANTVQASSAGIRGNATVTVVGGPLASITVTPNPVTLQAGTTQQFIAVGRDAGGNVFVITPTWSVVNGGGTINGTSGLFTAGAVAGTFANTVRATSGTVSGVATVTVTAIAPVPPLINLGTAAPNGIMAGTAFTCVTGGTINANIAISPGSTVTGFPPCVITGVQHLADAVAAQAQIDLTVAYNTLAALPCPPANVITGNLGGTTKSPGVYCNATGIGVTGTLTLDGGGDPDATFVFQAGSSLITAGNVVLIGQAQAKNVYWQVGSSATIGTASQWKGNILALTSITLVDNATLIGRALARNGAVSLGTNNVVTLP